LGVIEFGYFDLREMFGNPPEFRGSYIEGAIVGIG